MSNPAEADESPVDLSRVQETAEGDTDFEKELFGLFLEDSRERLAATGELLSTGNADGLRRTAHTLKGASGNIGAARMMSVAAEMEALATAGDLGSIPTAIERLRSEFQRVESFLNEYVKSL